MRSCFGPLLLTGTALLSGTAIALPLQRTLPAGAIPASPVQVEFRIYDGPEAASPLLAQAYGLGEFQLSHQGDTTRIAAELAADLPADGLWLELSVDGETRGERVALNAATPGVTFALGNALDMDTNPIVNLAAPASAGDAATKGYVDAQIGGLTDQTDDAVDSGELDNLCATDGKIVKRVAGSWVCADPGDDLGNHTATQDLNMAGFKIGSLGAPALAGDATTKAYVDGATVAKALALAANGGNCGPGEYAQGVDASGVAEGCTADATNDTVQSAELDALCALDGKILKRSAGSWVCADDAVGTGDNLGNHTATQDLDMASFKIGSVATPTLAGDAATKGYVDAQIGGLTDATDDAVDSSELDNLCADDGKILKRVGGSWVCADDVIGLQAQIQALQAIISTLTSNPCPPGKAVTAVNPDGTPVCVAFAPKRVAFRFDFTGGTGGIAAAIGEACPLWQNFVADAGNATGTLVSVSGSAGAPRTCSDPVKVAEIVSAMEAAAAGPVGSGNLAVIACDGFNWSISNFCAGTGNGGPPPPQVELKVSPETDPVPTACQCQTASSNIYAVRPCIGNQNWGGVGTDACNAPSQSIEVTVQ